MKLVVDDDPDQMRRRFCFLVDHTEIMEYGFGINPRAFDRAGAIASALLFLMRIYMAKKGGADAGIRVPMHEMQEGLRAISEHRQERLASSMPGLLPPGEEDIIDAELADEPGDGAEKET